MLKDIEIQEMTTEDVPWVAELEKECFSLPWSEKALLDSLSLSYSAFLVAKSGDKVAGYGGVYITQDEAEITNIAVRSEYRQCGIGRMIVEGIVEECAKRDVSTIILEVRQSNLPAISLYKKCGFEEIGTRKNFYEKPVENAVIMWKRG